LHVEPVTKEDKLLKHFLLVNANTGKFFGLVHVDLKIRKLLGIGSRFVGAATFAR
jgi:hypothetical protein